jgi:hypothetical protein
MTTKKKNTTYMKMILPFVQDTISVQGTGANGEPVSLEPGTFAINVVQARTLHEKKKSSM